MEDSSAQTGLEIIIVVRNGGTIHLAVNILSTALVGVEGAVGTRPARVPGFWRLVEGDKREQGE